MDFFNPIDAFEEFLQNISHDSSVILDFLVSNETCFLLYFLRMLKYLNKVKSGGHTSVLTTLKKVQLSIKKLTDKSLFPYDIKPVLKQLEKFTEENKWFLSTTQVLRCDDDAIVEILVRRCQMVLYQQ